jgi:cytochrome c5
MIAAFLVLLLGVLIAACGQTQPESTAVPTQAGEATVAPTQIQAPPALDGQTLLEERCTRCHDLSRVEQARKTADEWRTTVERMVGKGANLTPQEQEALIQYLAETYPK